MIGLEDLPCLACRDLLSNGAIVELASFRQKKGLRWRVLGGWLAELLGISDDDLPSEQQLRYAIMKVVSKRDSLAKSRRRNESGLAEFLEETFEMPTSHQVASEQPQDQLQCHHEQLAEMVETLADQTKHLHLQSIKD